MQLNKLTTLLILFISFTSFARWEEINSSSSENLLAIEFIGNTGFCGGANGELLKSTNGGDSWSAISSGTSDNITDIIFINSTTGYFTTSGGEVYKTTNGGSSWTSKKPQSIGGLNGIDFLNANVGLAVGDNGNIFRTDNAGSTWNDLGNVSVYVVNDVAFLNDTLAVAVGAQGSVLSSSDAGETWDWKGISSTNTFSSIEKTNDSTAIMVGTSGLYSEFNAGTMQANAETIIDNDQDWLKDVHLAPSGKVYIAGFNQSILVTNPNWKTWDLDSVNNLNSIHFLNDTIGFSCGNNGKIYKTITAGFPVGKEELIVSKLKAFPNPTDGYITFDTPVSLVNNTLRVYNMKGQIVKQIVLSSNENISIQELNTGLYFFQILTDNVNYQGRIIKK